MSLLAMSAAGSVVILAVIVIRALGVHRLPKETFTALWAVALLRLLVPAAVPSALSVYAWLTPPAAEAAQTLAAPDAPAGAGGRTVPAPAAAQTEGPAQRESAPDVPWRTLVWAAGALSCAGVFAGGYGKARRKFREAVPVENGFVRRWQEDHPLRRQVSVRLSGRVKTPVTYGLFRPVVLLGADADWNDESTMGFILAHEYGHIRRLDGLKKLVLAAAVCAHWFNPLVWAMFFLANRDMEMACDEQVVRRAEGDGRAAYARALIRMEEARNGLSPLVSRFSGNAMEERIVSIMKCRKLTGLTVAVSMLLTLGVTAVFATAAPERAPDGAPVPYDWGGAAVLLPMTEEELAAMFPEDEIRWWTPEEFAAWTEEQRPLLEAAVGSVPASGSVGGVVWTEAQSERVLAAYEDAARALERGAKLSRTINGDETVVAAVGFDWGAPAGPDQTVCDVETLLWGVGEDAGGGEPWKPWYHRCGGDGWSVSFGPSQTLVGLMGTAKAFFENRVAAGALPREEAAGLYQQMWDLYQQGRIPPGWQLK